MKRKLAVVYRQIDALIPYVGNSRTHSDEQVAQIAASIREFGFTNPILTDGENGIIAGHGRLMAARKLAMDEVPTIELAGLTAAQKRAYVIADNKLALNAGWDVAALKVEFSLLGDENFDIALTGFDAGEIAALSLDIERGENDPEAEWDGMPEFDQNNEMPYRTIKIHFDDDAAAEAFARTIDQSITDKTKFLWYPQKQRQKLGSYAAE
jgi:hypothetical protein